MHDVILSMRKVFMHDVILSMHKVKPRFKHKAVPNKLYTNDDIAQLIQTAMEFPWVQLLCLLYQYSGTCL